jgi:pyruvate formate lyase activating enzyme
MPELKEARYYERLDHSYVQCHLCPKECRIGDGRTGVCLGRLNKGGRLYARSYGQVVSMAMDPIEKKPLYHFFPGSDILSIATYGCNLSCPFCQNVEISKHETPGRYLEPEQIVEAAKQARSIGVAYTYAEPLVWFEYLMDTCPLVRKAGLKNVLVTNGMLNEAPLRELLPHIDAMNIDLKSIRPEFYKDFLKGDLETVKNTIRISREMCHIELTTLLIPGRNDSVEEITELVDFVSGLGSDTVLHFSRYFPHHDLDLPPTPHETLNRAAEIARKRLHYVYVGNVTEQAGENNTRCPDCGNILVVRRYLGAQVAGIRDGRCAKCGRRVDVVL